LSKRGREAVRAGERRAVALALLLVAAFASCGPKKKPKPMPSPVPKKYRVTEGVSSWYGRDFHGRKTASGEVFDMHAMTAAHRTLPLGTVVRVTNLETGQSAKLRINDRGPFVRGRDLDCSYGAAKALGFAGAGLARVRIEVIEEAKERPKKAPTPGEVLVAGAGKPEKILDGSFTVQVGAFLSEQNALRFRETLQQRFGDAYVLKFNEFYRVRVGHLPTEEAAETLRAQIQDSGIEGFVTRND
jgi:rare lipoprotein A